MLRRPLEPAISRGGAALFGALIAVVAALLVIPYLPGQDQPAAGDIAPRDLEARRSASYESKAETEAARAAAAAEVSDSLVIDVSVLQEQTRKLESIIDQVRGARQRTDLTVQQQLTLLEQAAPASSLSAAARSALVAVDQRAFESAQVRAREGLAQVLAQPARQGEIAGRVAGYLDTTALPAGSNERVAVTELLTALAVPNFKVDEALTRQRRENARANVQPVLVTYAGGQVIAKQGDSLTAAHLEALRRTGVVEDTLDHVTDIGAGVLAAIGLGLLLGGYLYLMQPLGGVVGRRLVLTACCIVVVLLMARLALPGLLPDSDERYFAFALPVAAAAMITASLLDLQFAAIVAIGTALFAGFVAATAPDLAGATFSGPLESFQLAAGYGAAGLAGAAAVHRAERFSRYAVAALAVTLATAAVLVAFWLLSEQRATEPLGWIALAAVVAGLGSSVATVGAFVVLSLAFGITTRLQLMELAQAEHPLLRRLQDEAPGTYHHSMMVGTLAERAAARIGADPLVARVGAYYHDIGKIAQPQFYIENMADAADSPHTNLTPHESARLILEHVTNGMDIARRHHLPGVVRDFIPQHHGTRLVTFFYRRAAQHGDGVDPAPFRYRGPRPQTRENGIVMLADSSEAVVRAAGESAAATLDDLVDGVFGERLAEGQLDECEVTMRELQEIAASFKATLRAIYHPRIQYPAPSPEELAAIARPPAEEAVVAPSPR